MQRVWKMGVRSKVRLDNHVGPVGAAEELRVLVHRSDEVDGESLAHGLEFERGLGLNATSGHGPPSPKPSASAGRPREGQTVCHCGRNAEGPPARVPTRDYDRGVGWLRAAPLSLLRGHGTGSQVRRSEAARSAAVPSPARYTRSFSLALGPAAASDR
jgi:hypothetical protein